MLQLHTRTHIIIGIIFTITICKTKRRTPSVNFSRQENATRLYTPSQPPTAVGFKTPVSRAVFLLCVCVLRFVFYSVDILTYPLCCRIQLQILTQTQKHSTFMYILYFFFLVLMVTCERVCACMYVFILEIAGLI